MDDQVLIKADQLSKKFSKSLKRSMLYGARELASNLVGRVPRTTVLRPSEFWAVDHIDLEVRRGQVLGIIGHNGCGKTTLLRLIAGIYPPDDGLVSVQGRVAALISLGVGFHPYLSGKENIFLNGALIGMGKAEIEEKMDQIIEFSELGDFINSPVATYSSGMRVRLGFSIAIAVEPDVLLLDEILAVGDRTFKAKSYKMIEQLSERTASILITHNMQMVARICSEIIVMERGRFVFNSAKVGDGIEYYQQSQLVAKEEASGAGLIDLHDFSISTDQDEYSDWAQLAITDPLFVKFKVKIDEISPNIVARLLIYDSDFNNIGETFPSDILFAKAMADNLGHEFETEVIFPHIMLSSGSYTISLEFVDLEQHQAIKKFPVVASFQVIDDTIAKDSTISRAALFFDTDWKLKPRG